ncbi:MAG: hypothetical protein Q8P21_01480, partial [bacterium]|nr:hypothetical protein [bacterium]
MVSPIFSDGKEYISAIRASKKIGYASDYIGQLCRAKKVPGELVGRTWYVDFQSLVEHKKARRVGKAKLSKPVHDKQPEKSKGRSERNAPKYFKNLAFAYESDYGPKLPELSKGKEKIKSVWSQRVINESLAISLALLVVVGTGIFALERTSPNLATQVENKIGNASGLVDGQLALALFSNIDGFFDGVVSGFNSLKNIALNKIFLASAPVETLDTSPVVPVAPPVAESEPPVVVQRAVTEVTRPLSLESLRADLKAELENYVRLQIGAAQSPLIIQTSSPVFNQTILREEILLADTRPTVTRQSSSDIDHSSVNLSRITDGGSFTNPTLTGASISGPTGGFTNLSFSLATGTSATTTNFFSTTASSTNLFSSLLTVGGNALIVDSSRKVGIATTSPRATLHVDGTDGIIIPSGTTAQRPTNYIGALRYNTTTSQFEGFSGSNWSGLGGVIDVDQDTYILAESSSGADEDVLFFYTAGAERARISNTGLVGIATTSPYAKLSVVGGTSGTVLAADALSGFSGTLLDLKVASSTKFSINQAGDLLTMGSTTLQNFTFANATGTNATTTNLFSTTASSTNLFSSNLVFGIGTTTSNFNISGNGAGLTFYGTGNHDITAAAGTLRIGSNTIIGNIEALDDTVDIGTAGTRFDKIYANEVNATSLIGTIEGGNINAETVTINFDNVTADTENSFLAFERGSVTPNALLTWNSSADRFEFNNPLYISGNASTTGLTTTGNLLVTASTTLQNFTFVNATGTSATTTNFFSTTASSTNLYSSLLTVGGTGLVVDSSRNVGIGTTSPGGTLSVLSTNSTGVTTSSALNVSANSLTTGTGIYAASSALTSGKLVDLQVSGTAAAASQTALNILTTGAN